MSKDFSVSVEFLKINSNETRAEMNEWTMLDGEWVITLSPDSHPKELMIEVSMDCNYDCVHCFRRNLRENANGFMSENLFRKLIEEAVEARVSKICFSGWGEPLLHPKIFDFMKMVKDAGMKVLLNTNGSLLSRYAEQIVELGIDELHTSVDAEREDLYEMLRVGGSFSELSEGLKRIKVLKTVRGLRKPEVTLHFTLNKINVRDLYRLPDYAKVVGASRIVVSNVIPLNTAVESRMACYDDEECLNEIKEVVAEVVGKSLDYGVMVSMPNMAPAVERRCPFISRSAAFIRWDGGVAPCIYYAHPWEHAFQGITRVINSVIFGNVKDEKLIDIWRDPSYVSFRARTYFFRMPSCLDCPLKEYCHPTLSNENDCWGNTPTCAACPYSHDMVRCPL